MYVNGNDKVGEAKVYATKKEMEQEKLLKAAKVIIERSVEDSRNDYGCDDEDLECELNWLEKYKQQVVGVKIKK